MRGTGYAISEILIFLAIASIIGFLVGWLVFGRRGSRPQAAKLDTKELDRAETRVKALEALMAKTERRAESAVAAASKAAALAPAVAATGAASGAMAKAPTEKPKVDAAKKAPEPAKVDTKKVREPIKAEEKKEAADKKDRAPAQADARKDRATKAAEPAPAAQQDKKSDPETGTGDEELDEYLTDADARIQKLEKTLERLRGKLDDLDE